MKNKLFSNKFSDSIMRTCSKYGNDLLDYTRRKIMPPFVLDLKHNLAYCRQAKVGTTTVLNVFLQLAKDGNVLNETLRAR